MPKSSNIKSWSVETKEIAKYAPVSGSSKEKSFKVFIAKLMPLIPFGKPKTTKVTINRKFCCNSSKCKLTLRSKIKTKNYLTINRYDNVSFKKARFVQGAEIEVAIPNSNVDRMYVSGNIDNTTD